MAPGCNGGMTAAGVGAITGIGLTSGTGFFVREMVGGGFFGMELIMPSLWLEIKSEGLVGCTVMPSSRGMYRSRHPSAGRPSEAGRNDYVESPAKLERQFQEALERNRQQLDEQRARIKREAAVQADWPVLPLRAKTQFRLTPADVDDYDQAPGITRATCGISERYISNPTRRKDGLIRKSKNGLLQCVAGRDARNDGYCDGPAAATA